MRKVWESELKSAWAVFISRVRRVLFLAFETTVFLAPTKTETQDSNRTREVEPSKIKDHST